MIERDLASPFLEGARSHRLMVQRCASCGSAQLPPALACGCGGRALEWVPASGRGQVESFAVIHRAPSEAHAGRVPYVYAAIRLDEGARMISNVVGVGPDEVRVGQAVEVVFERTDGAGQVWPEFRVCEGGATDIEAERRHST